MAVISGNGWVPLFHAEARSDAAQSRERAVSAQRQRVARQRCWERPGCQNSSVLLQRLQVVIAFQVVDLRSDVFRTGDEGEVEKKNNLGTSHTWLAGPAVVWLCGRSPVLLGVTAGSAGNESC